MIGEYDNDDSISISLDLCVYIQLRTRERDDFPCSFRYQSIGSNHFTRQSRTEWARFKLHFRSDTRDMCCCWLCRLKRKGERERSEKGIYCREGERITTWLSYELSSNLSKRMRERFPRFKNSRETRAKTNGECEKKLKVYLIYSALSKNPAE